MDVFIGKIPTTTTPNRLRTLCGKVVRLPGSARVSVVRARDGIGNEVVFGRVSIEPDSVAKKLIRRLNGCRCGEQVLEVREFVHRSYSNERRALDWRSRPWPWADHRRGERRRFVCRTVDLSPIAPPWAAAPQTPQPRQTEPRAAGPERLSPFDLTFVYNRG